MAKKKDGLPDWLTKALGPSITGSINRVSDAADRAATPPPPRKIVHRGPRPAPTISKEVYGPPAPTSITRTRVTPTRVTRTTVRDSGGGGDFNAAGVGVRRNPPPPSPPSFGGNVQRIFQHAAEAPKQIGNAVSKAVVDKAVPHQPDRKITPPKTIFPKVDEPSPSQQLYAQQADQLLRKLAAQRQQALQRQRAYNTVGREIESYLKAKGEKVKGKYQLSPAEYKHYQELQQQAEQLRKPADAAWASFDDTQQRVLELDEAYKADKQIPQPPPEPWDPDEDRIVSVGGHDQAFTKSGRLVDIKKKVYLPKPKESGADRFVRGALMSVLPWDDGHLDKPEVYKRFESAGDVIAQGLIAGGQGIWHRAQSDARRGDYIQAKMKKERDLGRDLTPQEDQRLASGFGVDLLAPRVGLSGQNLINFAAGAGGAAYGLSGAERLNALLPGTPLPDAADPVQVAKDIGNLVVDATVGTGLFLAAMSRPDLTTEPRRQMIEQMPKGIREEYTKHFGKGLSWQEAASIGARDPVGTALLIPTPVGAGAQATRILMLTRLGLKGGKDLRTAMLLARDPAAL